MSANKFHLHTAGRNNNFNPSAWVFASGWRLTRYKSRSWFDGSCFNEI